MRVIVLLLTLAAGICQAGGFVPAQLSRAYGPFHLGMSEADFSRLTGIKPGPCAICLPDERLAIVEGADLARIHPQAGEESVMDFFFYRGRLYQFTVAPREGDLKTLARRLSDRFQAPPEVDDTSPDLGQLRWQDEHTRVTLNYDPQDDRVIAIKYDDLPTLEARQAALDAQIQVAGAP